MNVFDFPSFVKRNLRIVAYLNESYEDHKLMKTIAALSCSRKFICKTQVKRTSRRCRMCDGVRMQIVRRKCLRKFYMRRKILFCIFKNCTRYINSCDNRGICKNMSIGWSFKMIKRSNPSTFFVQDTRTRFKEGVALITSGFYRLLV